MSFTNSGTSQARETFCGVVKSASCHEIRVSDCPKILERKFLEEFVPMGKKSDGQTRTADLEIMGLTNLTNCSTSLSSSHILIELLIMSMSEVKTQTMTSLHSCELE